MNTRHNIGFEVIDALAATLGWIGKPEQFDTRSKMRFDGLVLEGVMNRLAGEPEKLLLLKPTTFMNLSGRSVQAAASFYQLGPDDLCIVLDDLALPCGRIRLRPGGSSGGHNGLKDIQRALGTEKYPRLRVGIDAAPTYIAGKDYVLGRFSAEQRVLLGPAIDRCCGAIATWIDEGIEPAMTRFNGDEKKSAE